LGGLFAGGADLLGRAGRAVRRRADRRRARGASGGLRGLDHVFEVGRLLHARAGVLRLRVEPEGEADDLGVVAGDRAGVLGDLGGDGGGVARALDVRGVEAAEGRHLPVAPGAARPRVEHPAELGEARAGEVGGERAAEAPRLAPQVDDGDDDDDRHDRHRQQERLQHLGAAGGRALPVPVIVIVAVVPAVDGGLRRLVASSNNEIGDAARTHL
ncbi:MAG: hypothetical protein EBU46_16980, partial [Nitrosomonadaceae bacterium]|nr:hypothetical protein [Nitrosomonadaceae bacterium]